MMAKLIRSDLELVLRLIHLPHAQPGGPDLVAGRRKLQLPGRHRPQRDDPGRARPALSPRTALPRAARPGDAGPTHSDGG